MRDRQSESCGSESYAPKGGCLPNWCSSFWEIIVSFVLASVWPLTVNSQVVFLAPCELRIC